MFSRLLCNGKFRCKCMVFRHCLRHKEGKTQSEASQPKRQFLKISVLFFQEQPFYNFPGGSICSSNRYEFSRRVYIFSYRLFLCFSNRQTHYKFSRTTGRFEKTCFFMQGGSIFSLNRPYYLVKQMTDTNFPRNSYLANKLCYIFLVH